MLGKTNIIYVTKNQNSEMQFVAETIVTRSSSDIKKMKYLNGVFFVFTEEGSVLYGQDITNLNFLKNGEQMMTVSNVVYYAGKYVLIDSTKSYTENAVFYISEDLSIFEECFVPYVNTNTTYKYGRTIWDIEIDSYNRLVFLVCGRSTAAGGNSEIFDIYICNNPADISSFEMQRGNTYDSFNMKKSAYFMNDRFLCGVSVNGKDYCRCITMDGTVETLEGIYYPIEIVNDMAYVSADSNTYYSLNFVNYIKVRSLPITNCFLIGNQIGLYNEGALELASKVTDFASGKSTVIEITGIDYAVLCYIATEGYTYLGCEGGIIIQCLLDTEGIYQMPEITLVKTLAAKEALEQAKKYTDRKITELMDYVDKLS